MISQLFDILERAFESARHRRVLAVGLVSAFVLSLGIIELARVGLLGERFAAALPRSHFHAIELAFTLLLAYEVTGLVFALAKSVANAAGKQFEIFSLILLRHAFEPFGVLDEPVRWEQAREAVSAALLVEAVLPLVRLQARKSGTLIELDMPTPAPRVQADRTMVEQVLLNLTRNGIQAMEGDETPAPRRVLRIGVRVVNADWVEFAVADAGPGIAPEVAQRLFTPFFTTRSEGMGLGLSLCRTVIEQHGGALDFDTGPAGTRFRFTLRAARSAAAGA